MFYLLALNYRNNSTNCFEVGAFVNFPFNNGDTFNFPSLIFGFYILFC